MKMGTKRKACTHLPVLTGGPTNKACIRDGTIVIVRRGKEEITEDRDLEVMITGSKRRRPEKVCLPELENMNKKRKVLHDGQRMDGNAEKVDEMTRKKNILSFLDVMRNIQGMMDEERMHEQEEDSLRAKLNQNL
eukprot:TRINITY_DN4222_c0_g1_i2.p1 TRINITY_DN4222_c0_g1~~TRINITY_DN4222_c0_g1_i2.p1  ORF type:complete len:135 (+),score=28.68 TRINITY_DN4222_c0_g1_i2:17-421(+)